MADLYYCCPRGKSLGWAYSVEDVPAACEELRSSRTMPPKASFSTCVHEAAHSCAAFALGGKVGSVTVDQRYVSRAETRCSPIERAAHFMIGKLAENRLARRRVTAQNETVIALLDRAAAGECGSTCDDCGVGRLLSFGPSDEDIARGLAAFRRAEELALRMAEDRAFWAAVLGVADALDARKTLTGDEVAAICGRHIQPGQFKFNPNEKD